MRVLNRRGFLTAAGGLGAAALFPLRARTAEEPVRLRAGPSSQRLFGPDAPESALWTYNGAAPGPEIRARRGERVRVRLVNGLDEPTSIHWHGIRIDNSMDGVAGLTQEPVPPGESFDYDFVVPDAGTFWYHAHTKSWDQVARGLYGPLIVEEDEPLVDPERDLTLVIDDWRLDQEGRFDAASLGAFMDWTHAGRLGNWLTVNGRSVPEIAVEAGRTYRLRLINAANARILAIDPNHLDAEIMAYDGQSLPAPRRLDAPLLFLGPAQRADLLFRPKVPGVLPLQELSGEPHVFARFAVSEGGQPDTAPVTLVPNPLPEPELEGARKVSLRMAGGAMGDVSRIVFEGRELEGEDFRRTRQAWSFNEVANLAEAPLFRAARGETVVVETVNATAFAHAMHVHGHHFRVLDGEAVSGDSPWRDTFLIAPDETLNIAFVADNPGKWLLHCHMLEHAAAGMNTWFEVT